MVRFQSVFVLVTLAASGFINPIRSQEPTNSSPKPLNNPPAAKAPPAAEADIRELKLRDWEPRSKMVTKTTILDKPLFPVVDVHNHLGGGKERLTSATVARYLTEMNEAGVKTVVKNATGRSRALEGLAEETVVLAGSVDGPVQVPMNGAVYMADVLGGQKTGLFFDQRPNHAFAAALAKGARVLDVFSHVGGFALAALGGGAAQALSVDSSAAALALAVQGAQASGFGARYSVRQGDAFEVLESLGAEGAKFEVVICDPPAFAPAKPALEAGLRAYERIARLSGPLVAPGGYIVLCSCSHAVDLASFRNACARGLGRGGRRSQLIHTGFAGPDHPMLPQLAESGYLKSLVFRLD